MKITDIQAKIFHLELIEPVKVALGEITHGDTVLVQICTDNGLRGYGEGAGVAFVTGETCETVLQAVSFLKSTLLGRDPWSIPEIHAAMDEALTHHTAAKAAIDLALYDLCGKDAGVPLYRLLGGSDPVVETDKTISLASPDRMVAEADELVRAGFRHIKIKAGLDPRTDIEVIRRIREAVGPDIHLKVDANQGWTVPETLDVMRELLPCRLDAVEQPTPFRNREALVQIHQKAPMRLMADESVFSPQDAMALARMGAVDSFNIKLMKSGGLYPALAIDTIAEAAGLTCMVGCMVESRVGMAAAAALVAARKNIVYGDLDSVLFLKEHPQIRGGFTLDGPFYHLTEESGLGVEVDF